MKNNIKNQGELWYIMMQNCQKTHSGDGMETIWFFSAERGGKWDKVEP